MPIDATPEERLRAVTTVHEIMLRELWTSFLSTWAEPMEEAKALERDTLEQLESTLETVTGRDAELTQHLAIDAMEALWKDIRRSLAEAWEPLPIQATEEGLSQYADYQRAKRRADRLAKRRWRWPRS